MLSQPLLLVTSSLESTQVALLSTICLPVMHTLYSEPINLKTLPVKLFTHFIVLEIHGVMMSILDLGAIAVHYGLLLLKHKCLTSTTHTMELSLLKILILSVPSKAMKSVMFMLAGIMLTTQRLAMLVAHHLIPSHCHLLKKYIF
jgi:hypothetical protein